MKPVKLYEQFVSEGIFRTYNEMGPYEFNKFVEAYKELHPDNQVVYDKKEDETWGFRKGEKDWRYDHDSYRIQHSERDRDVLGLIHGKALVSKNHPWSK
jgi:hypothetical protein